MVGSFPAENIAKVLRVAVDEWEIPKSRGFPPVVTDNAANVTKAVSLVESTAHVPCLAHTINLAVQKALKVSKRGHKNSNNKFALKCFENCISCYKKSLNINFLFIKVF